MGLSGWLCCQASTIDGDSYGDGFFLSTREGLDATMNYGAHSKFVEKWLHRLDEEDLAEASAPVATTAESGTTKTTSTTIPATTTAAEVPTEIPAKVPTEVPALL
jgi:hypothetical protein